MNLFPTCGGIVAFFIFGAAGRSLVHLRQFRRVPSRRRLRFLPTCSAAGRIFVQRDNKDQDN